MRPDAFYEPDGDLFHPTAATIGPWSPDAQHAGPPSALLARAIERVSTIADGQTARISFDILGPVPLAPLRTTATVLRPGRRVELCEASLSRAHDGAPVMHARAWRMRRETLDAPIPGPDPPLPPPEEQRLGGRPTFWEGEHVFWDMLEWRWVHGDIDWLGPAAAWSRLKVALVAGEPATPLQHLITMTDAASGASRVLDFNDYVFANVDLNLVLERPPAGEWMGMDAVTTLGPEGAGAANATLYDATGRVGTSSAALLVAAK
ncbi:MAG: hypothetical protein QOF76_4672 [Solirubrobacteraceae bacterium]|nr:hypothetical protein [Solirubrobacteraceae bacterium]